MYFYEAPPSEDDPDAPVPPDQGMALVCAEYWPPASMEDIWMTDTGYHPSEDWDEMRAFAEGGAAWITELEARRPDFVAEFDRIRELVRDVFGEPTQVMQRADGMACAVWERGATALALIREANAWDYEVYDWLVLRVLPRQGVEGLAEDF